MIFLTRYDRALDILRGKKQFIEKAAHMLLEKEKIDGEELKALLDEWFQHYKINVTLFEWA